MCRLNFFKFVLVDATHHICHHYWRVKGAESGRTRRNKLLEKCATSTMVYGTNFLTGRLCSLFLKLPSEKYTSNWPKNMGYAIKNKLSSQEIWQERIRGNDKDKLACPHSNETGMCPLEPLFFKIETSIIKMKAGNYKWQLQMVLRNLWMAWTCCGWTLLQ